MTMKLYILFSFLLSAVLCSSRVDAREVKFGPLCSGNQSNLKRGCDTHGCGHYGARRESGPHKGLDIVCADGATVYAPFDVKLDRKAVPYENKPKKEPINDGIKLSGEGQKIGTLLPMQKVYPGITSHVHVQMCDISDPTKYF